MATYKVKTNKSDYAPGSTATILAEGFAAGSTLEFRVQHVIDPGQDLLWGTIDDVLGNNTGSGHESWFITDGGAGDTDGIADGTIQTTWYVNPDDSLGATFLLTATGRVADPAIDTPETQVAEGSNTGTVTATPAHSATETPEAQVAEGSNTDMVTAPPATGSHTGPVTVAPVVQVATATFTDSNPIPVQFFYVPKPEDQLLLALQTIESGGPGANPINPVQTYVSIAAIAGGTIIYYDHWEDGYETNIANPTQSTTQIWGDGVLTNGVAPGTSNDLINAGTVLVLNNAVNTNVPVMTDYDGGDKIGATKTVAMTRIGWASGSNTLLTSGLEVFDTDNYGTDYKVPVGVNIADGTDFQMFEYTGIFIQAGELTSVVNIDINADGTIDTTVTLTEGQSYLVNGGVHAGARVLSDNPVRVELITGDIGSNYESRDAALLPVDLWSNSYYTPVSTPSSVVDAGGLGTFNGTDTTVWLYNPGPSAIDITYEYRNSLGVLVSAPISVLGGPAGGYVKQVIPDGSGAHFFTASGESFYAISTTDSKSSTFSATYGYTGNQNWDWGFDLVPESSLTTQVLIGFGLGRDPTAPLTALEISNGVPQNGSPAWVTPVGNGETPALIYVDYNGDNLTNTGPVLTDPNGFHYDATISLKELERAKVFDPDGDQTGMLLYTLSSGVKLAAAWGQDPLTASVNRPGIDTGTGVPPLPTFAAGKSSTLLVDADGDGFTSPGDTLLYTVSIPNTSRAPVLGLLLQDKLSVDATYVAGTTKINYDDGTGFHSLADAVSGTSFLFDEGGTILGDLAVGKIFTVTFEARIDAFADLTQGVTTVINTGKVSALGTTVPIQAVNPLYGSIGDFVWTDLNSNGVQDGGAEAGIGGVVLNLYKDANNNSILDGGDILTATKTTDGNGGYLFTGLLAGHYIVDVVESTVPASYQLTTNNDPKPVNLAGGQDDLQADFGYQPVSSLSGYVYKDAGNDGAWDGAPAGIGGVNVTLAGVDDLGNYIELTTTTLVDGSYSFTDLRPSDQYGYTVTETQPSGYFDGKDTAGSTGGNVTTINDQINGIVLNAGINSINNNFGELPPARISGFVYKDAGNDGAWDGLSAGISGVTVTLTGVDDLGNPVNKVTTTNPDGSYDFFNLRPSNTAGYIVTETQPVSFADGKDTAGSTGGNTTVNDVISGILLDAGGASVNNNFGEILPGSLSGFVYVDLNNNGTRQTNPTETPIASVTLTLTGTTDQGAITPVTTTTNGSGFYQFLNLRPGTYTVTETQPTAYKDGLDTRGNAAPIAGSNNTDVITDITVVSGASTPNNNFGELLPATVSGFVYVDANNNGLKESTETGIGSATPGAGVTVTLTGIDDLGNAVSLNTTTVANGAYSFNSLRPSNAAGYTVTETQPSNYVDGKDTAGSAGGNTAINDVISGIVVAAGDASANNNFGEVLPVSVSGYVYADANDNGVKNSGEAGIGSATPGAGVTVSLTGTNDLGQVVSLSTTTLADGSYSFGNLRPSNLFGYTVTETQPAGYFDGKDTAGSAGGDATVNDKISGIVLLSGGDTSTNNNFGEQLPANITPTGIINGYVYVDANNNGNRAGSPGEPGISGVTVKLTGTDGAGNPVNLSTTTGNDGAYQFDNLFPSDANGYTVTETQPSNYVDGKDTAGTTTPPGTSGTAGNDVISHIVLTDGGASTDNNFGELGSTISGKVYNDTGVALGAFDGTDVLLAGSVVTLYQANGTTPVAGVLPVTVGANGEYIFTNVPLGNYVVKEVNPAGYGDVADTNDTGGTNTNGPNIIAVSLTAGTLNSTGNNFLDTQFGSLSGFAYVDVNNNGIKDIGETPISGVSLILSGTNDLGPITPVTVTTLADGSYSFGNLRHGTYSVTEAQPAAYNDGLDALNNVPISGSNTTDVIFGIIVNSTAADNNFGELSPVSTKGLVAPTGTTPEQYIHGTAQTFEDYYASTSGGDFQYSTKAGLISQTNPGLMFYFSGRSGNLVADSTGHLIINFVQDNTNSNFSLFDIKNPKLYTVNVGADGIIGTADDSVTNITNSGLGVFTTTDSGDPGTGQDQLQINISGAAAGQHFIVSAQYNPTLGSVNAGALNNPSVHYNFSTNANGITVEKDNPDSLGVSGVDLVYKAALTLAGDPVQSGHAPVLNEADLQQVIDQAISYWAQQGTDAANLAMLSETPVQISDLGGKLLAQTDNAGVTIDDDAAGYGWSTGLGNVDLSRVDLLSVVTHELGHVLGYDHDVMDATLAVGERDLPQVDAATTVDATAAAAGVEVEVVNLAEQVSTDRVWMV